MSMLVPWRLRRGMDEDAPGCMTNQATTGQTRCAFVVPRRDQRRVSIAPGTVEPLAYELLNGKSYSPGAHKRGLATANPACGYIASRVPSSEANPRT
ncbi:hypothetical protein [Caballeronia sp. LZ035]|uniref:hypothetical protein n=1 Tax=Caballeronia sp. LZ035 TaxID=3038568 RepID=UPI00285B7619|nr:hypothetical protein [Caballeronia sp. LZ035]MDR5763339.1 hypothetical protein [Caballeronia sp. LZ035]